MNDGTLFRGSRVLAIGTIGVAGVISSSKNYVAESFNVNRPQKVLTQTTENDAPAAQASYADFVTGTATIFLDSTAAEPVADKGFTQDVGLGSAETFFITDVSRAEGQGAIKKVNISFRKMINLPT